MYERIIENKGLILTFLFAMTRLKGGSKQNE